MPHRTARPRAIGALGLALAIGLAACGGGSSDPERSGATKQAVEELHGYGLTAEQARCVVGKIGADTVVEAADLNALAESEQYQDAAKACVGDG